MVLTPMATDSSSLDPDYVKNVIVSHSLARTYQGERLLFPMIDVKLSKENAMSDDLWGFINETRKPSTENMTGRSLACRKPALPRGCVSGAPCELAGPPPSRLRNR
jgi:hypothetical protein